MTLAITLVISLAHHVSFLGERDTKRTEDPKWTEYKTGGGYEMSCEVVIIICNEDNKQVYAK